MPSQRGRPTSFGLDADGLLGGVGAAPVEDAHRLAGAIADGQLELLRRGDARRLRGAGDLDGGDRVARLQPRLEEAVQVRILLVLAVPRLRDLGERERVRRQDAGAGQAAGLVVFRDKRPRRIAGRRG